MSFSLPDYQNGSKPYRGSRLVNDIAARPLHTYPHPAKNTLKVFDRRIGLGAVAFCALHIPLGILLYRYSALATLHGLAVFAIGAWWAVSGRRNLLRVACVGAYIAGVEVLWRMAQAETYWEFGKYAIATIFLLAILRTSRLRPPFLILCYFVLLLPSAALTFISVDATQFKATLSFNMSGPLALMVSVWFFSRLKLSTRQLQRLFVALIGPALGVASITIFSIASSSNINFAGGSNVVTSGGFGPNQVSATLGLGVLIAFLLILIEKTDWKIKIFMLGGLLFLAVQSALTFSRGGLYNAAGGAAIASLYLIRDPRSRLKFLFLAVVLFVSTNYFLLPRLDAFTEGALSARFKSTSTTGRDRIAMTEIQVWLNNPVFGVGPGRTPGNVAHTEFTRLLSEHGTFGLLSILVLTIAGARNIRRAPTIKNKALAASMMGWSFLFMLNAGMRLAAPAFAFGLAFITLLPEEYRGRNFNRPRKFGRIPRQSANSRTTVIAGPDKETEKFAQSNN